MLRFTISALSFHYLVNILYYNFNLGMQYFSNQHLNVDFSKFLFKLLKTHNIALFILYFTDLWLYLWVNRFE